VEDKTDKSFLITVCFLIVSIVVCLFTKRNKRYFLSRHKVAQTIISICQKPPKKTFAKRFSQDIFPSSVGIVGKGTTIFADMQEKSHFGAIFGETEK